MLNIASLMLAALLTTACEPEALTSAPLEVPQPQTPSQASAWLTNYDTALTRSRKTGKPVLVDFTGSDWCGWCIRLKAEVFDTPAFQTWARRNVILLELDFPRQRRQDPRVRTRNEAIARKYGVRSYPTILFLDAKGKVLGRSGYRRGGPRGWTAHADRIVRQAAPTVVAAPKAGAWLTDHAAAVARSKRTGKPILADFTGSDWCTWCIRLDREVFETGAFRAWAKQNVVLLKLDFPRGKQDPALRKQNQALARKYGIRGYPTVLFIGASGTKLGEMGYERGGPQPWIARAGKIVSSRTR
ncbi:MAG: hypothetical protein CMJ83_22290 [Planctomycetes bacterium]|nr:hypothetical protein [Planctomycetota bacterium]